ncbi:hypothetical protein Q9306_24040 [Bacillus sp. WLY-B-L8]|nr:hypothetical protein [Bacillus sp. WLY-B-L8]
MPLVTATLVLDHIVEWIWIDAFFCLIDMEEEEDDFDEDDVLYKN